MSDRLIMSNAPLRVLALLMLSTLLASVCVVATATADQDAPELPGLFDELKRAESAETASQIEAAIWQHWLTAPDESSHLLSTQLGQAMQGGRLDLALTLANQLVDGHDQYAEAWNRRATIHYLMGNDDLSVADIRETLILEPRHFGAISGLGLIFLRQGDKNAALDAFEQVLNISPVSANAQRSAERVRQELGREI